MLGLQSLRVFVIGFVGQLTLVTRNVPLRLEFVSAPATFTRPNPSAVSLALSPCPLDVVNVTVFPESTTLVSVPACSDHLANAKACPNNT